MAVQFFALFVLIAAVRGQFIPKSIDGIASIEACEDEKFSSKLCVSAKFNESLTTNGGTAYVSCKHYSEDRATPPGEEFALQAASDCNLTGGDCKALLQNGVQHGTQYFVFCSGWAMTNTSFVTLNVMPSCNATPCGIAITTGSESAKHEAFGITTMSGAGLLMAYIGWSIVFKLCPWARFLHETGFAVIVGLLTGFFIKWSHDQYVMFSYEVFSYFVLPMVIFAAGFNLEKANFFKHSGYILTLGVTGTVLIFLFIFYGSWLISEEISAGDFVGEAHHVNIFTAKGRPISISSNQRLVLASVLASTDSVAPVAFLSPDLFPQLYAVVFGEGVLNDVLCILLNSATRQASSVPGFIEVSSMLAYMLLTSSAVGLLFGLGTSLLFKSVPALQDGTAKPSAIIFLSNYMCYAVAEMADLSSIFALFLCALLCGHYAAFSLSHGARDFTTEASEMLSYLAEAFVFGYFGLTSIYFIDAKEFSVALILFYSFGIMLARFVAVLLLAICARLVSCGKRPMLSCPELTIVGLAGVMRGTIAYALILKSVHSADSQSISERVMVSTVLGIVMMNCLVFGAIFPVALRILGLRPNAPLRLDALEEGMVVSEGASLSTEPRVGRWAAFDDRVMKPFFRASVEVKDIAVSDQAQVENPVEMQPQSSRSS